MAVNEARRLKGSSVSDDAMASSFDGRKASEAIERGAAEAPSSQYNVDIPIVSLPKAGCSDH